jgi:hypothetical protein
MLGFAGPLSASIKTKHGPQPSNPDEVMVIVFGVELRAIDKTHRHLKAFMEGCSDLEFG